MTINTRTFSRTVSTLLFEHNGEDREVELMFVPQDYPEPFVEVVGDKLVVAYLVHDDDCGNPMTENDGMGELITSNEGVITDGNPWPHLGLLGAPYRGNLEKDFDADGVYERAKEIMWSRLEADADFHLYCEEEWEREGEGSDEEFYEAVFAKLDPVYNVIPPWMDTIWERCQDDAWDELQEQGKIGTYLAVPVRYCDSVHGPGPTQIYTTGVDDCNAVWIPTDCDIDNIKAQCWPEGVEITWHGAAGSQTDPLHAVVTFKGEVVFDTPKWAEAQKFISENYSQPTYQDLYKVAEKYAQGCLEEYEKWCNGDCYGCVCEVFECQDGDWVQISEDACWGFIGYEYAKETLEDEFFKPNFEAIKEKVHEAV